MSPEFSELLARYDRIAVAGVPRAGKTTLVADVADRPVFHTDDLIGVVEWADQPEHVNRLLAPLGRWVVEGVQVARSLRKGLLPDAVVVLMRPKVPVSKGQAALGKAVTLWLRDWRDAGHGIVEYAWDLP